MGRWPWFHIGRGTYRNCLFSGWIIPHSARVWPARFGALLHQQQFLALCTAGAKRMQWNGWLLPLERSGIRLLQIFSANANGIGFVLCTQFNAFGIVCHDDELFISTERHKFCYNIHKFLVHKIQIRVGKKTYFEMISNKYTGPGQLYIEILTEANVWTVGACIMHGPWLMTIVISERNIEHSTYCCIPCRRCTQSERKMYPIWWRPKQRFSPLDHTFHMRELFQPQQQ